jgi:hypothetical protein
MNWMEIRQYSCTAIQVSLACYGTCKCTPDQISRLQLHNVPDTPTIPRCSTNKPWNESGLYGYEQPHDPSSVKSRTGFDFNVANCPVIWTSRLQHLIAKSTTEGECNVLSESMRDVLPLQEIIKFIAESIGYSKALSTSFQTMIHEDNTACLKLANLIPGQFIPRTKDYSIKVH